MRRPIETAPKDGKTVILEDDVNGTYELARWSAQECAWVGKNGKPHKNAPTYWHAMQRAEHLEAESNSSGLLQMATNFPNLGPEPQPAPASADVFARPPVASPELVRFVGVDKQIAHGTAHRSEARRRFAASCGAALVAVSLTGMYFRGDVAAYAAKHAERSDQLRVAGMPQSLLMEQSRKISMALNPTDAPASAGQVTVGKAPTQSPEPRTDAMENELLNARQALAAAEERETQLKQTAEIARTNLQQSLDKIATLENELAQARQHTAKASLSPRRSRRIRQRRLKQSNPPGFFGIGG